MAEGLFTHFYPDEETSLDIIWPDFDSYIKHLAKSTRRNVRLHGIKADELGVVVTAHSGPVDIDQALTLIYNVDTYHRVGHRPWTKAILENASMVIPHGLLRMWMAVWLDVVPLSATAAFKSLPC